MLNKKQEFFALINNSAIGIISVNNTGEIILINEFALKQFGYAEVELLGNKIEVLVPPRFTGVHEKHRAEFHHSKAHSRPMGMGMELHGIKKDGTEFPVEVSLSSYIIEGQQYAISFISDITIRKKSEEELRRLNASLELIVKERTLSLSETVNALELQIIAAAQKDKELQKALEKQKELNELKSRFVTMASHEFRTPLSTILSSSYLLSKYQTTEEQPNRQRHIDRIVSAVTMLTDTLNDFLSLGKIDEGRIQVKYSKFNIKNLIETYLNEISTLLKDGQKISYSHTGNEDIFLDHNLLLHIIMNLVSNAIKFSPLHAMIKIQTSKSENEVFMVVQDEGMGISEDDQSHLFERFYRGVNATNIEGTGLGLHLVSKYVELLHGRIQCKSILNQGTEFSIVFKNSFV
ncbi:MAG: hypothetical protein NVSMB45_06210 [Ginsengibacter sp.]